MPTDQPETTRSVLSRLPDPTVLSVLGLLSLPSYVSPRFAVLRPFVLFFLFGLWPFVALFVPSRGESPTAWIRMGDRWLTARFLASILAMQLNPYVQFQSIRQLLGQVDAYRRYRFSLPDSASFEGTVTYRLPVEGEWTVVNGSHERAHSHSWGVLAQRYAYDLVVTDEEGRTHTGAGTDPTDYYCFDEPIVAPAAGVVVAASDGHRDAPRTRGWLDVRQHDIRGNYLVIRHAPDEYSVLAHLREGSLTVEEGDRVEPGQRVGRCGHSGNSTEPHLHFHVQDCESFYRGMGLPVTFSNVDVAAGPTGALTHVERAALTAGDRVAQHGTVAAEVGGGQREASVPNRTQQESP